MADTALSLMIRVLRDTGQGTEVTSFSDNDETKYLLDRMNEALQIIYGLESEVTAGNNTVTITPSTRQFSPPSGVDIYRILPWSFRINNSAGDIPLNFRTLEDVVENHPDYEAAEGKNIDDIYFDGEKICVRPLLAAGEDNKTLQFHYPTYPNRMSLTTDTFPWEDMSDELRFIETYMRYRYEAHKGLGNPGATYEDYQMLLAKLHIRYGRGKRKGITGYRKFR